MISILKKLPAKKKSSDQISSNADITINSSSWFIENFAIYNKLFPEKLKKLSVLAKDVINCNSIEFNVNRPRKISKNLLKKIVGYCADKFYQTPAPLIVYISGEPDWLEKETLLDFRKNQSLFGKKTLLLSFNTRLQGLNNQVDTFSDDKRFLFRSPRLEIKDTQNITKTRLCSLLVSNKEKTIGHLVRNLVKQNIENLDYVDIYPKNNQITSINSPSHYQMRLDSLIGYKFTVIVENAFTPSHLSEQIKDALLTKTIPIYYGDGHCEIKNILIEQFGIDSTTLLCAKNTQHLFDYLNQQFLTNFYDEHICIVEENRIKLINGLFKLGWDGKSFENSDRIWFIDECVDKAISYIEQYRSAK